MIPLRRTGGLGAVALKVWAVLRITMRSRLAYLGEVMVGMAFTALVLYIFSQLWRVTGASMDVKASTGYGLPELIWYLAFTEAIGLSTRLFDPVGEEVRSGDVAYRLARPLAYPAYHLGAELGERFARFGVALVMGSAVALLLVGPIAFSPVAVMAALLAALVGFVADWLCTFSISLTAFWTESTYGPQLFYRRMVMLLGGMLVPLEAYPEWLQAVARALPFQYLMYGPARLFVQRDASGLLNVLAGQLGIGLVGLAAAWILHARGLRKVGAQGG